MMMPHWPFQFGYFDSSCACAFGRSVESDTSNALSSNEARYNIPSSHVRTELVHASVRTTAITCIQRSWPMHSRDRAMVAAADRDAQGYHHGGPEELRFSRGIVRSRAVCRALLQPCRLISITCAGGTRSV